MLPSQLYQFTGAKDAAGGRLESAFQGDTGSAANVLVQSAVVRCPLDRIMMVNNLYGEAIPGAAQNALSLRIVVVDEAGNEKANIAVQRNVVATIATISRMTQFWIPPGFGLRAIGLFDAGAAVNFAGIGIAAILFPRGNVQIGSALVV